MPVDEALQESDVKEILRDFLIKNNLENAEIRYQNASNLGDGFLGVTNSVEIKDGKQSLFLFIKTAPKDKNLREVLLTRLLFLKEIYFYSKVIPAYDNFLCEKSRKPLAIISKCYSLLSEECKEIMILDNLKEQGFIMFDRKSALDDEHILLILKAYAKFHGVSYALKDQKPEQYRILSEEIGDEYVNINKHYDYEILLEKAVNALREHGKGEIAENDLNRLHTLTKSAYDLVDESIAHCDAYRIILHGDCWVNNMLFKYERNGRTPTDIRLLDFQLLRVNLPVFDLSYFFYCSATTSENLSKLDYYLQYYHDHLSNFIRELGSDPDKIYPYGTFKEHWKKFSKANLLLSLHLTRVVLAEGDEIPNIAEKVKLGTPIGDILDVNLSDYGIYVQRMKDLLSHFITNDFM